MARCGALGLKTGQTGFSRCYALSEGWVREASKIIFISFASSTFVSIWEGNSHKANILQDNSNQANNDQIGSI